MTEKTIRIDESLSEDGGYFLNAARLIESTRSDFQDVEVYETVRFGRLFRLDGCFMTSEGDEFFYHENMIHVPLMAAESPKRALIIGGGDGGSAEELFKYQTIEKVVLVELDAKVIAVARDYLPGVHKGALDDPRLEIRIQDGLKYVREDAIVAGETFDLIVLDLTDPVGPAEDLYSETFFADCKKLLTPGGAISLHIGSPIFKPQRPRELVERLRKVFTTVTPYFVYIPLYGTLWGMACAADRVDPTAIGAERADQLIAERALADLNYLNGESYRALFALPNYLRVSLG